jgi:EmrB/QacA subfamily drug resistance transporter
MTELSPRRRMLVLAICCMSLLIVGMDNTIVNVALPSIRKDLGASVSGLQWTIDAYTVVLASLLVLAGSTADRVGRRRTFQTGLILFVLGSLLCSVAPGLGWLVAFRMVQAVGGSMLNPVAMSIITNVFTEPKERARAIGVWGGVVGLSLGLGPVVGGALTESVGWRAIFWINIPIGLLACGLAAKYVPESRAPRARRPDAVGQVLMIMILAGITYAIIASPHDGWGSLEVLAPLVVAIAALVGFLRYEPRRTDPLIELRFFRSAPFGGATIIAVFAFGAYSGFLFLNTLYLQDVRGLSALDAGLYTIPLAVMTLVCAPLSGRLVGARGPRTSLLLSGLFLALGGLMLTSLRADTSTGWLLASYFVFGLGFGIVNPPITNTAVSGMPRAQAGVASAIASTSRQVGASLGVAIVGSVVSAGATGTHLASASHPAWWIVTGCGAGVFVVGLASTGNWAKRTAQAAARELAVADAAMDQPVAAGAR